MLRLGALISMDFTKYFTYFHLIFFDNMDWYLNPKTDLLINIVPEVFGILPCGLQECFWRSAFCSG